MDNKLNIKTFNPYEHKTSDGKAIKSIWVRKFNDSNVYEYCPYCYSPKDWTINGNRYMWHSENNLEMRRENRRHYYGWMITEESCMCSVCVAEMAAIAHFILWFHLWLLNNDPSVNFLRR